ncbi:MAG: NUDIX domain-containing protein [Chloroflexi bacterium]|nr:NUDIX domain-containing protein [Chloroflexota bacterium]
MSEHDPPAINFCVHCGAPVAPRPEGGQIVFACTRPSCGRVTYRNAKPCAGVLLEDAGRLLLVQRATEPFRGDWDIPGGFLHEWEHPAAGALREALEETGLHVELTALLGIFIDSYGAAGYNTLNIYYRARVAGGTLRPADDAARAEWFAADGLPANIAFPDHEQYVLALWRDAFARNSSPQPEAHLADFVSGTVIR